jgi:uncharacterized protein YqjF (DUF2071 family)
MLHYEVDPIALARIVPLEVEVYEGRAFVSLVAFTMRGMRPRRGGWLGKWLMKPISTHEFLNARTYVRQSGEVGIYFLAEWLANRISVALGPRIFGLPYRLGQIEYDHSWKTGTLRGRVSDERGRTELVYRAEIDHPARFEECESGSLCEWLMERYTAFTQTGGKRRFFRVWHRPWLQTPAKVVANDKALLDENWPFLRDAKLSGANFSPGLSGVWMGRPHSISPRVLPR